MDNSESINDLLRQMLIDANARQSGMFMAGPRLAAFDAVRAVDKAALIQIVRNDRQANWFTPGRGWCLLDEAVRAKSLDIVEWLLLRGANPNTLFLQDKPCSKQQWSKSGLFFSPLANAISSEQPGIAAAMLRAGASLDLPCWRDNDGTGQTCRDLAIKHGMLANLEAELLSQALPVPSSPKSQPRRI